MIIMFALFIGQKGKIKGHCPLIITRIEGWRTKNCTASPVADQGKRCVPFFRPSADHRPDPFGELLCVNPQPS
jgi:hypothetical protein